MARHSLGSKSPFSYRNALVDLGLVTNICAITKYLGHRCQFFDPRYQCFISLPVSIDSYIRMIDPLYFGVFIHSLWMAGITTIICLLLGYPLPG